MLEYDFIGNVRVRSDFRLFVVDGGHTWINYGVYSALNYAWILDPVINVVIVFSGFETEGLTLVSLCVFYYFSYLAWRLIYTFFYIISL